MQAKHKLAVMSNDALWAMQGQDISGACGQLVVETSQVSSTNGKGHSSLTDIEEVGRRRVHPVAD
jgi:hypothetical protein